MVDGPLDGDFYPFPDVEWTVDVWGAWAVAATYEDLSVRIDAAATDGDAGCPVRVPTPDGMRPGATETYSGALTVEVTRGTERLLLASSDLACLEVGGDYGGEAWRAESAMTEPLKTIAFNLDLERAISTQLDNAQRRGWLDIPGLIVPQQCWGDPISRLLVKALWPLGFIGGAQLLIAAHAAVHRR